MKLLHEVTFVSFLEKLQAAIQEGYTVDFENSDTYPRQFGFQFMVNLVNAEDIAARTEAKAKAQEEAEASGTQEQVPSSTDIPVEVPKAKRGPKPKA